MVYRERPTAVVIDLKLCAVDLEGGRLGDRAFLFANATDTLAAGLAAEMERRQLATAPQARRRRHLGSLAPSFATGRGQRR